MTDKIYTIDELREIITPIAIRHHVDKVYLFGSYARGEANANSDVDLRVDGAHLRTLIGWGNLYADLQTELCKKLDLLVTEELREKLDDPLTRIFLRHMKQDEVTLYAGNGLS